MRSPLPTIPIPLRAPDRDVYLDLGAAFRDAFERGRYRRAIRYSEPPEIALSEEDLRWATELAQRKPA